MMAEAIPMLHLTSAPIRFTDDQIAELIDVAKAVPADRRSNYLEAIANQLRGRPFTSGELRRTALNAVRSVRGA
jgi:hypothetical protein